MKYLYLQEFMIDNNCTLCEAINSYVQVCKNLSTYLSTMLNKSVIITPVFKKLDKGIVVGAQHWQDGIMIKEYFHYDFCKEAMIEEIYKFKNKEVNK